jgi:endonuclease-3
MPFSTNAPDSQLIVRAQNIYQVLLDVFGLPEWRDPLPPLDELVSTILSQNTNDRNRDAAFFSLKRQFTTWEDVRDAPAERVIDAIRMAGLANQKGPRIQTVLKLITAERGSLDLSFLSNLPPNIVHEWLTQFNGVGPKTAAIVMQFSLGMPAFPVDTHIYRVSGRLGLRPAEISVEQAHLHLAALFEPKTYGPAHLNLIRLGREICTARKPRCSECPLQNLCDYAQANISNPESKEAA